MGVVGAAEVPGSKPVSRTIILGRCRIIVWYCKTQGRMGYLHLRPKRYFFIETYKLANGFF